MKDRRSILRVIPERDIVVSIGSTRPAVLVDISSAGAQLELASSISPNRTCRVSLPLPDGNIKLRARVAHCKLVPVASTTSRAGLVYRAGLEFLDVDLAVVDAVSAAFGLACPTTQRAGPMTVEAGVDAAERADTQSDHNAN